MGTADGVFSYAEVVPVAVSEVYGDFYRSECGGHYSLDSMHSVFRFIKDYRSLGLEHLVGNLHTGNAELIVDLLTDGGIEIVECGEAMHKAALSARVFHNFLGYAVGGKIVYAFFPNACGLAHGYPHVGIDNVCALGGVNGIHVKFKHCPSLYRYSFPSLNA